MLFDLRGGGRRRAIQAIYLTLAVLMGGGLVLFGIGGNVSGGLFDAFTGGDRSGGGSSLIEDRAKSAQKRATANPRDAGAWAALARARYQLAGQGSNFDQATGQFTRQGLLALRGVAQAWERYLALEPKRPDTRVARLMVQAFGSAGLGDPVKALRAQEIVVDGTDPPSANGFFQLAVFAYAAGQNEKADRAAQRAVRLTPADLRESMRDRVDLAKLSAKQERERLAKLLAKARSDAAAKVAADTKSKLAPEAPAKSGGEAPAEPASP